MIKMLRELLKQRVLVLDGAMGTMLQQEGLRGNNDEFSLTRPEVIQSIHRQYLEAGADIITTNTFSSQRVSQQEYNLTDRVVELNRASVRLARQLADEFTRKDPSKPRFVAGTVGPTSKMLSMSEDVNDPAARSITFDALEAAYREQIDVLITEGVDIVLVETIFDTLNAKAALSAYQQAVEAMADASNAPEVMLSMTVSDASGRTLSGQTVAAFVTSVLHANPLAVGLNCGLGAAGLLPWLRQMSAVSPCYVSCHPNAGLPNQEGAYDQSPAEYVEQISVFLHEGLANIVGGCCGTTPRHIEALATYLSQHPDLAVRQPADPEEATRLAGLEAYSYRANHFINVGERCNVAGSRKFLRLINEKKYDEALEIAKKQVEDGADVIDVNMDDGMLDASHEMSTFLNLLASDPEVARVPVMIDSSRFEVIEAGLKCLQGKGIVNSISLKMGEEEFLAHARVVKRLGASIIVMCFDEEGQATNYERRVRISQRAYNLLVQQVGFQPYDIIFDPNVLTIATGMAEHNDYAASFIRATRWIHDNLPGARVSGGLSNLSFAFRGNNVLRESMHSVFLHFAIPQGMNMAILNPAAKLDYNQIPPALRLAILECILNTSPEAGEHLAEVAQHPEMLEATPAVQPAASAVAVTAAPVVQQTPEEVLKHCLLKGSSQGLIPSLQQLIEQGQKPIQIISGPLMDGMNEVGTLFGEGKMFLPQVVKTARTMKQAVEFLQPYIEQAHEGDAVASTKAGKILIATVKGDVHDIGKNIVGVVLACNNFEVIDLGVMVPPEVIVREAIAQKVDFVCLSGLITPSLEEMRVVAEQMQAAGLRIPLLVGGATTSPKHTALKLAPYYNGPVFHVRDAAQNPALALRLLDPLQRDALIAENRQKQEAMAHPEPPKDTLSVKTLIPYIDWLYFFWAWRTKEDSEVGKELKADALKLLQSLADAPGDPYATRFEQRFYRASGNPARNLIQVTLTGGEQLELPTPRQTEQSQAYKQAIAKGEPYTLKSLADFVPTLEAQEQAQADGHPMPDYLTHIGAFAVTMSQAFVSRLETLKKERGGGDYDVLLLQTLGDRLAEASAEYLSQQLQKEKGWQGIRPAVGYPSWPEQRNMFLMAQLVDMKKLGITITENGAMYPQASVSGLYLGNPEADYFTI